jgi:hypothetical protein
MQQPAQFFGPQACGLAPPPSPPQSASESASAITKAAIEPARPRGRLAVPPRSLRETANRIVDSFREK